MLINASVINGAQLNGSSSRTAYGNASVTAGATVSAVAFIAFSSFSSVPASGAVVLAGLYNLDMAEANVVGFSQLHVQASAYVLKSPNISINGVSSISIDSQQTHKAGSILSGVAEIIAFQGDSAAILGSATVDPNATLGMATIAKADGGNAIVITSVILHAGGVDPVIGGANIDAVPSMIYAGDTFTTHDAHTRLAGAGLLEPPDDPLHKILSIENGGFLAEAFSSANSTIAHAGFSASSCFASVLASPIIDLYQQASILFPAANVQASASLIKSNTDPVIIDGISVNYFTGSGVMLPFVEVSANSNIEANAGNAVSSKACCLPGRAAIIANPDIILNGASIITGSGKVLANMSSNPHAHAADRRILYVSADNREVIVSEDDRTITVRST